MGLDRLSTLNEERCRCILREDFESWKPFEVWHFQWRDLEFLFAVDAQRRPAEQCRCCCHLSLPPDERGERRWQLGKERSGLHPVGLECPQRWMMSLVGGGRGRDVPRRSLLLPTEGVSSGLLTCQHRGDGPQAVECQFL